MTSFRVDDQPTVDDFAPNGFAPGYRCIHCGTILDVYAPMMRHHEWLDAMEAFMVEHRKDCP